MVTPEDIKRLKFLIENSTPYEHFTVQLERIDSISHKWTLSARPLRDPKSDVDLLLALRGMAEDIVEHFEKEFLTPPTEG